LYFLALGMNLHKPYIPPTVDVLSTMGLTELAKFLDALLGACGDASVVRFRAISDREGNFFMAVFDLCEILQKHANSAHYCRSGTALVNYISRETSGRFPTAKWIVLLADDMAWSAARNELHANRYKKADKPRDKLDHDFRTEEITDDVIPSLPDIINSGPRVRAALYAYLMPRLCKQWEPNQHMVLCLPNYASFEPTMNGTILSTEPSFTVSLWGLEESDTKALAIIRALADKYPTDELGTIAVVIGDGDTIVPLMALPRKLQRLTVWFKSRCIKIGDIVMTTNAAGRGKVKGMPGYRVYNIRQLARLMAPAMERLLLLLLVDGDYQDAKAILGLKKAGLVRFAATKPVPQFLEISDTHIRVHAATLTQILRDESVRSKTQSIDPRRMSMQLARAVFSLALYLGLKPTDYGLGYDNTPCTCMDIPVFGNHALDKYHEFPLHAAPLKTLQGVLHRCASNGAYAFLPPGEDGIPVDMMVPAHSHVSWFPTEDGGLEAKIGIGPAPSAVFSLKVK